MRWTSEQQIAITTEGNLIVSAAAGPAKPRDDRADRLPRGKRVPIENCWCDLQARGCGGDEEPIANRLNALAATRMILRRYGF